MARDRANWNTGAAVDAFHGIDIQASLRSELLGVLSWDECNPPDRSQHRRCLWFDAGLGNTEAIKSHAPGRTKG